MLRTGSQRVNEKLRLSGSRSKRSPSPLLRTTQTVYRFSAKRLEICEQVRDVLRFQPFQQSFRHHGESGERGSFDIATRDAQVFRVWLAQHERVLVLRNQHSIEHFAVARLDTKTPV